MSPHPPRQVTWSWLMWFWRAVLGVVFVSCLAGLIPLAMNDVRELKQLAKEGQRVSATVVDRHVNRGKSTSYYIHYSFTLNGRMVTGREKVSYEIYDLAPPGSTALFTALPSDPYVHRYGVVGQDRVGAQVARWWLGVGAIVIMLVGTWLFLEFLARRQKAFLEQCLTAEGKIVSLLKKGSGKSAYRELTVDYKPPGMEERQAVIRVGAANRKAMAGDKIYVLSKDETFLDPTVLGNLVFVRPLI